MREEMNEETNDDGLNGCRGIWSMLVITATLTAIGAVLGLLIRSGWL